MIRVLFISRMNLLAGRTNVYNFAKTCEMVNVQPEFSASLVTTDEKMKRETFFQKMGIKKPYEIISLSATSTTSKYGGQGWYQFLTFFWVNLRLAVFMAKHFRRFDAIYFRDESLAPVAILAKTILGKPVFFEIHSVLESQLRQKLNLLAIR